MKKAAIFGCGSAGQWAWAQLRSKYRIVAFLDNDPAKHGSKVRGVEVCDPEVYNYDEIERVFIASIYLDEILVQLLQLGVASSKIDYVNLNKVRPQQQTVFQTLGYSDSFRPLRRVLLVPFRLLY
jgi:FlaA1/EpsC-like NDP-sugar epimerase